MKVALVLNVVAAALNMGTATLQALPTSPSPKVIVVIHTPPRLSSCWA
jgi:hypothetical protein